MGYNVYDVKTERILKEEEINKRGILMLPDGRLVAVMFIYAPLDNIVLVDVSERYKPLHKIGCG